MARAGNATDDAASGRAFVARSRLGRDEQAASGLGLPAMLPRDRDATRRPDAGVSERHPVRNLRLLDVSGTEVVAVVSVVVSGVVGPFLVQRWGMVRLRWEAQRERENRLVDVVERAATALTEAHTEINDEYFRFALQLSRAEDQGTSVERVLSDVDAYRDMATARSRNLRRIEPLVALRLTTQSDEARQFGRAASALDEATVVLVELACGEALDDERSRAFDERLNEATAARYAFSDAVAKRIGPGD